MKMAVNIITLVICIGLLSYCIKTAHWTMVGACEGWLFSIGRFWEKK